jgi:hypothetical protein
MDSTELLTDFLPSILGMPDPDSLQLLGQFLYHPEFLVRLYVAGGITYWPDAEADAAVAEWIRVKGPSDMMFNFLARSSDGRAVPIQNFDSILENSLPYLRSDSPVLVNGAVNAVLMLTNRSGSGVSPELRARAIAAAIEAGDHIRAVAELRSTRIYDDFLRMINK